ncbi:MAG: hypothetical protein IPP47_28205 [Bryobacterales bacterium]|nr:hypothetical protein [Bryobacterales bacterium]
MRRSFILFLQEQSFQATGAPGNCTSPKDHSFHDYTIRGQSRQMLSAAVARTSSRSMVNNPRTPKLVRISRKRWNTDGR